MTSKKIFCGVVLIAGLVLGKVHGQTPSPIYQGSPMPGQVLQTPVPMQDSPGLSDWIMYSRGGRIQGPVGGNGPILSEVYMRGGPTFPIGGTMGDVVYNGWSIQGGARALFFDVPLLTAWIMDIGMSNYHNQGTGGNSFTIPQLTFPAVTKVRSLNRTFFNVGVGRQWYVFGSAGDPGLKLFFGLDGGGRYGSAMAEFDILRHRTDVIGGAFGAVFSGAEIPVLGQIFQAGVRGEFSYTWSDILIVPSDVSEINVYLTLGVRF